MTDHRSWEEFELERCEVDLNPLFVRARWLCSVDESPREETESEEDQSDSDAGVKR